MAAVIRIGQIMPPCLLRPRDLEPSASRSGPRGRGRSRALKPASHRIQSGCLQGLSPSQLCSFRPTSAPVPANPPIVETARNSSLCSVAWAARTHLSASCLRCRRALWKHLLRRLVETAFPWESEGVGAIAYRVEDVALPVPNNDLIRPADSQRRDQSCLWACARRSLVSRWSGGCLRFGMIAQHSRRGPFN